MVGRLTLESCIPPTKVKLVEGAKRLMRFLLSPLPPPVDSIVGDVPNPNFVVSGTLFPGTDIAGIRHPFPTVLAMFAV